MSYHGRGGHGYGSIRKAQKRHARRSPTARHMDENLRAPKAKNVKQWMAHPNRFDLPNVDTPKHKTRSRTRFHPVPHHSHQKR